MQEDNGHYLSIDMGLKNTLTCYDSEGKTFLLSGLLNITHYFDKEIARCQGISDRQQSCCGIKYPKKTKKVRSLYQKKKNKVSDFIHKATRYIAEYCQEEHITTVVTGDMKGIRKETNLGRINQQLHAFPYEKIYQKLEYKLKRYGIRMIRQKESYSSQCSPKSEKVGKVLPSSSRHNRELMEKCALLKEYATFIATIRKYMRICDDYETAVNQAVEECIKNNILSDVLRKNRAEDEQKYEVLSKWFTIALKVKNIEEFEENIKLL